MAKTNKRKEAIAAFNASADTKKPSEAADLRQKKTIEITDPEAIEAMKEILTIRKRLEEYVEENLQPLAKLLKKHEMRATGIRSEESVHCMEFWDRLHEMGLTKEIDGLTWCFDYEEKEGEEPRVWVEQTPEEKGKKMPEIIKYLLKALGAEGSLEEE